MMLLSLVPGCRGRTPGRDRCTTEAELVPTVALPRRHPSLALELGDELPMCRDRIVRLGGIGAARTKES
jgi:hypothetical protein